MSAPFGSTPPVLRTTAATAPLIPSSTAPAAAVRAVSTTNFPPFHSADPAAGASAPIVMADGSPPVCTPAVVAPAAPSTAMRGSHDSAAAPLETFDRGYANSAPCSTTRPICPAIDGGACMARWTSGVSITRSMPSERRIRSPPLNTVFATPDAAPSAMSTAAAPEPRRKPTAGDVVGAFNPSVSAHVFDCCAPCCRTIAAARFGSNPAGKTCSFPSGSRITISSAISYPPRFH